MRERRRPGRAAGIGNVHDGHSLRRAEPCYKHKDPAQRGHPRERDTAGLQRGEPARCCECQVAWLKYRHELCSEYRLRCEGAARADTIRQRLHDGLHLRREDLPPEAPPDHAQQRRRHFTGPELYI